MMTRVMWRVFVPAFVLGVSTINSIAEASRKTSTTSGERVFKPHILIVVADDHGFHDPSFTGSRIQTPTIDRLRHEGIALEQHYVQKVCSPTRSALHTSRYPHRNGMQTPFCGGMPQALNLNETLLPEYLNKAGYESHAVGKWHLGFVKWEYTPTFRGYKSFYGYYNCAEDYFWHGLGWSNPKGDGHSLDFHDDPTPNCGANCSRPAFEAVGTDWQHYSTTLFSNRVVDIVEKHDPTVPLFLYFASQDTHGPAQVPDCYRDAYNDTIKDMVRRVLAGKLSVLDSALHNITAAYDRTGMLENLIIFYTADNGGPIVVASGPNTGNHEDAIGASNYPLRGGKHNAYEGGVRSTAFITGKPLQIARQRLMGTPFAPMPPGAIYSGLMHVVDWVPTICEAVGATVDPRPGILLDGVSHWKSIIGNTTSPRTRIVLDIEKPNVKFGPEIGAGVVRIGEYKLHIGDCGQFSRPGDWSPPDAWLNVTANEPSTYDGSNPYQLFNVVADPSERFDLINNASYSAIVEELKAMYAQERVGAVYPFNRGPQGEPVLVQDSNPLSKVMAVWLPWL